MMPSQRALLYGLAALLIAAPLRFGAVEPLASAILVSLCLALGVLWVAGRARRGLPALPWRDPILIAGTLFALLGVAQTIPIPRGALEVVAPRAVELRGRYEPAADERTADGRAADGRAAGDRLPDASSARPISLYPWATRQATLRLLAWMVACLIALDLATQRAWRRSLAAALVAGGGFQAVYGLAEYFSGRQQIFGYAKQYYTDVATGTFINRNHFAGYLEMTLPLALALAAIALSRLPERGGGTVGERLAHASGRPLFAAVALLILALTMATALVCSRSRMGIASLLLALLSSGVVLVWRGRGRVFAATGLIVAGATLLVFSQADALAPVIERFTIAVSEFRGSVGRWQIWSQAAALVRAFPILGVGLGAFPHVLPAFRDAAPGVALDHAHNDLLELAAETGLIGAVLAAAGAAAIAIPLLRRKGASVDPDPVGYASVVALVSIGYHSITDFNLAIPSNAFTLSVVAGIIVAWLRAPAPVLAVDHAPPRPWLWRAWAPACLLLALALLALAPAAAGIVPETIASRIDAGDAGRLFQVAGALGRNAMGDLEVLARAQAGGTPASPEAASYIENRLAAAMLLQRAGLRHFPISSRGHLEMGHLRLAACAGAALAGRGRNDCAAEAMPELRAALALDPMSATTHAQVARLLAASWDLLDEEERAESRDIVVRAVRMNPGDPDLQGANLAMGGL